MKTVAATGLVVLIVGGFLYQRIVVLEKRVGELGTEVKKAGSLDAQARCATRAKAFLNETLMPSDDKLGLSLVDYTNHYNKSLGKCFIVIRRTFSRTTLSLQESPPNSLSIDMYDVFENREVGRLLQFTHSQPDKQEIVECYLNDDSCQSLKEFENRLKA